MNRPGLLQREWYIRPSVDLRLSLVLHLYTMSGDSYLYVESLEDDLWVQTSHILVLCHCSYFWNVCIRSFVSSLTWWCWCATWIIACLLLVVKTFQKSFQSIILSAQSHFTFTRLQNVPYHIYMHELDTRISLVAMATKGRQTENPLDLDRFQNNSQTIRWMFAKIIHLLLIS